MIAAARAEGRPIVLASGSHWRYVQRVARSSGPFDIVIGTRAGVNLTGAAKLSRLRALFAGRPFDYIGNSRADLPLWRAARRGYTTDFQPARGLAAPITPAPAFWRDVVRSLRVHQWSKNVLVFVPLLTAGLVFDVAALARATVAAVVFSLVASAIYQVNDILDVEADRAHATKRERPIAAGRIGIAQAALLAVVLLGVAFAAAALLLNVTFILILVIYVALTTLYSVRLKSIMTLDVITLACLYTIRIFAGSAAAGIATSFWLLVFSVFFFLSLGYLKRYTELAGAEERSRLLRGRGYIGFDIDMVAMSGVASAMVSILVMALFINDARLTGVYRAPDLLWLLCLCLLYWINRVWLMARRGEVEGDPIAFAIRDGRSLAVGAMMAAVLLAARFMPQ
jgi:4-hydroxybenzoate polyprenyltransferase